MTASLSFLSDLSIFKIDCSLYKHWPTITFLKPRLGSQSPPRLSPFSASSLATSSACAAVYSTPQKRRKATLVEFSARHNPLQQLTVSRKKSGDEPMYLLDQKSLSKTISLVAHALFGLMEVVSSFSMRDIMDKGSLYHFLSPCVS